MEGLVIAALITSGLAFIGLLYSEWSRRRNQRDANDHSIRNPTPPTTQEVWVRLDSLELKFAASCRMIVQAIDQHPPGAPPLVFDQADVEVLADTLPRHIFIGTRTRPAN